jgi:hypothetical protein
MIVSHPGVSANLSRHSLISHLRLKPFARPSTRLRACGEFAPIHGRLGMAHLARINGSTSSVLDEERDPLRAGGSQYMVRIEEELWDRQVIGDEGNRLRRDEFGHVLVR